MRVTYISTFLPQSCGIATYSHYLTQALAGLGTQLRITLLAEGCASGNGPVQVDSVFRFDSEYVADILHAVKRSDPHIVHIQHEYGIFGLDDRFHHLLEGLQTQRIPTVVTLHSVHTRLSIDLGCGWWRGQPPMEGLDIERYQSRIGELADVVIVHQDEPIRKVLLRQGLDAGRVVTVPHGTLLHSTPTKAKARVALCCVEEGPLLVGFGHLEPSKNYQVLIQAVQLLRRRCPSVQVLLCGFSRNVGFESKQYRTRCENMISDCGLQTNIKFLDFQIPENMVAVLLTAADVACFVYDEDTRSSSGALHHALGCGKAIVASRIPKFQELNQISDEILVNPRSPTELSRVLGRLLMDSDFRSAIERNVQEYAQETAWPTIAARHLDLYYGLLRRRSGIIVSEQGSSLHFTETGSTIDETWRAEGEVEEPTIGASTDESHRAVKSLRSCVAPRSSATLRTQDESRHQ